MHTLTVSVTHRRLPSGTWNIRFRAKGRPTKTKSFSKELTEREFLREKAHFEREITLGRFDPWAPETKGVPLELAVKEYIAERVGTGAWNPETTKGNSIRLRQMCEHLPNRELTEITQWVWWERPGWAAYTKKGFFIATRAFCKWAAGKGYITYPAGLILSKGTKMQAKQKKLRAITMDQLADICAAYRWQTRMAKAHRWIPQDYDPTRHIHMWWMIFRLTLRKGEIPKVMPGDVEPGHINVIRKGGKRQRLYIYEALQPHIDWFRDHQIPGKPFFGFDSMRGPAKILHRAAKLALGPDFPGTFGFHTFRHAGITYMIENQIPIHMVSEYAGHASVSITLDAYAHVIKANEQTKMDGLD